MLVFGRQESRQETDVRILGAHALKGTDVRPTHTVTCGPESWIHAAADTNHHGQSEGVAARGWQHNLTDEPMARVFIRKFEICRKCHRRVNGIHSRNAPNEKAMEVAHGQPPQCTSQGRTLA